MARKRTPRSQEMSRWDRFLFRIMGPPDVGDPSTPTRTVPVRVETCPTCGQPRDTHEVVRTGRLTYTQCPGRPAAPRR